MNFPSIRIEGAILSPDLLDRLDDLTGQRPADFGIDSSAKVKDEIARAWADAQDYWRIFHRKLDSLPPNSLATTETRNLWIVPLLGLLGYQLEYQHTPPSIAEKSYPISHRVTNRANTAVHITGYRDAAGLDRKPERTAGPRMSAHALVQEYLNLSDQLYGVVTNGRLLRLLRDSSRLIKLTYLEFDLDRIFTDGLFADFAVLYRILHASRLPVTQESSAESLIERYHQDSVDSGSRIRDGLSRAVEDAIRSFANGLLIHEKNDALRTDVQNGTLKAPQFYQHLLRLIYRLLFLFVIEERNLVYPLSPSAAKRDLYYRYYSLLRIRRLAEKRHLADPHKYDLWLALMACFQLFEDGGPGTKMGIAPLGGDLFSRGAIGSIRETHLDNATLLRCLRSLSLYQNPDSGQTIRVNYAALNVEEFGSVYEGLLEYEPVFQTIGSHTEFAFARGDERAATGSHYTPDDLVQPLLKHSLDHLIAEKLKEKDKEKSLLSLRVADISCGSGHILLAAARRIATELAIVRTGDEQPSPGSFRTAIRDVIRECIYGVDLNPLAVELCKVALWLEAHSPGEPLNFLDHHIKCGNAIVGYVRREELERGMPDEAFATLPGDDKDIAAYFRRKNKKERDDNKQSKFHLSSELEKKLEAIREKWDGVSRLSQRNPTEVETVKKHYYDLNNGSDVHLLRSLAAIPPAQFYLSKTSDNRQRLITDEDFRAHLNGRHLQGQAIGTAHALAHSKKFFHWFLEFPEIIEEGGFDCILGNPPYLGGTFLSGTYGHAFCQYVKWEYAPTGLSDLVVYFVRRIYTLLKPNGFSAFITTNSIKDGDIRKDGLEQIITQGGSINFAVRALKWPGRAKLVVSLVSLCHGQWNGVHLLDNKEVDFINAYFEDSESTIAPFNLSESSDKLFKGYNFIGDGFILSHQEAHAMRQVDSKNVDVIFPLIRGQEINSHPEQQPGRHIIYFRDWPKHIAQQYEAAFKIVEEKVKPGREKDNRKSHRDRWWIYGEHRPGLTKALVPISHCFVTAETTKHLNFSALPTDLIYTNTLYVFTTNRWDLYSVVQSGIHEVWARKYSGALKQDLRYSPSKCFDTFAFPKGQWQTENPYLATLGERYHKVRKDLMAQLWLGLTDIYNLFHASDLTPEKVAKVCKRPLKESEIGFHGILQLRDSHRQLDEAVLAAYGWTDLPLGHSFYEIETLSENDRIRYSISPTARKELLKRLLVLNHQRHAEEALAIQADTKIAAATQVRKKKAKKINLPTGTSRKHSKGINFKRGAIASYAVNRLGDRWQFGRIQMEKVLYLAQQEVGVDLEMKFQHGQNGPFDEEIHKIESLASKEGWFVATPRQGEKGTSYNRGKNIEFRCEAAVAILGENQSRFDSILDWLEKMDTEQAEIWATVHAVWNELIITRQEITEDIITQNFYNWHSAKKRFKRDQIVNCIDWMRKQAFVPRGINFPTREAALPEELDLGLDLFGQVTEPEAKGHLEVFGQAYPASQADRLICALSLELVEWRPGITSIDHLDALILATHPELCISLSDPSLHEKIKPLVARLNTEIISIESQGLKWSESLKYLTNQRHALSIQYSDNGHPIIKDSQFDSVRLTLPTGHGGLAGMALSVLDKLRKGIEDNSLKHGELLAVQAFNNLHTKYSSV